MGWRVFELGAACVQWKLSLDTSGFGHVSKRTECSLCPRELGAACYHWTRWIVDKCPLLDTCPNPDVSSDNFH